MIDLTKKPPFTCHDSAAPAEPKSFLEEVSRVGDAAICDDVQQYSGYYKLTTGDKNVRLE